MTVKGLYKQLNNKKTNSPVKNGQKTSTDISPRKTFRWPVGSGEEARHHQSSEKCKSNYNELPPHAGRVAITEKSTNYKCWRGHGKKGALLHCWWECQLVQPLKKNLAVSYKVKHKCNMTAGYLPQRNKYLLSHKVGSINVHRVLFKTMKHWKTIQTCQ